MDPGLEGGRLVDGMPLVIDEEEVSPSGSASRASKAETESSEVVELETLDRPGAGGRFGFLGLHLCVSRLDSVLKIRAQKVQTTFVPESSAVFRCVFKC